MTPMDREYGKPSADESSTNDAGIGVQDLGWGLPMGIGAQNIQGIAAKIREGAGALEIQFSGAMTGNRQQQTPGMYGKEQREAIKELAQINEVNLTTHAAFGIMGLGGMDPRSGNFSGEYRKLAVDEIKRAIEFAGDVAKGGSVVVHTGEYQRPISESPWAWKNEDDPSKGYRFRAYEGEEKEAVMRVIDSRDGHVIQQVRKNEAVQRPVWLRNDRGQYVDYEGKVVDRAHRVPEYDPKTGRFRVEPYKWENFIEEAEEMNQENAKRLGLTVKEFEEKYYSTPYEDQVTKEKIMFVKPEEASLKATLEANEGHARGWALYYSQGFEKSQEDLKNIKEQLSRLKHEEENINRTKSGEEREKAIELLRKNEAALNEGIRSLRRQMEYMHQSSVSQQQLAEQARESKDNIISADKFALKKSFQSYAEAGIYAMDQTKAKKTDNPIFISMENVYPESYGSHPDELKRLVLESRKTMADMLVHQRGFDRGHAEEAAKEHIKATLDVGHMNTWRKYWQNDPSKSLQQNDADFRKWMLDKTEDLAKAKIIGNVHLADNFGYQDEHLTPGEGTTPIKEMVAILKKHGYKGALTVEAGAAATTDVSDFHGLMKTWRLFGSPVYGAHLPVVRQGQPRGDWSDIQYSYFGQTTPPYFVFGQYRPSEEWVHWSQLPFE